MAIEDAAEDFSRVFFDPGRDDFGLRWDAPVKFLLEIGFRKRQSRWAAVYNYADDFAVALAEACNCEFFTDRVSRQPIQLLFA